MRKLTVGLLIATSSLVLAGCEKKAEVTTVAEVTEVASTPASEGADAEAAATDEGDPNGNPIKP